jgi:N-acetylglucosaminyldiphosphoundecaprenol N-acetyl-beta-D-mannosaminyltransferase
MYCIKKVTFLGHQFDCQKRGRWLDIVYQKSHSKGQLTTIFTPNVHHIVNAHFSWKVASIYSSASMIVCDSKFLQILAKIVGKDLCPYPGSSLVNDIVNDARFNDVIVSVAGPSYDDFIELQRKFPLVKFVHIATPMNLVPQSNDWYECIRKIEESNASIHFLCISFPKQEMLAADLSRVGSTSGVAICGGASIDFLTGKQRRAPEFFQSLALEWLYRLISNPHRLWRRYLCEGPKIFKIYIKTELRPFFKIPKRKK